MMKIVFLYNVCSPIWCFRYIVLPISDLSISSSDFAEIFVDFTAVLEDFGEYTDPEAFEVWGRSLMKVNDYQTAKKKITLALENAKVIYVSENPHTH